MEQFDFLESTSSISPCPFGSFSYLPYFPDKKKLLLNEFVLGSGFLKQKIDFQGGEGNAVFITSLSFSCWFDQQKGSY